jgi:hypothetical protein
MKTSIQTPELSNLTKEVEDLISNVDKRRFYEKSRKFTEFEKGEKLKQKRFLNGS